MSVIGTCFGLMLQRLPNYIEYLMKSSSYQNLTIHNVTIIKTEAISQIEFGRPVSHHCSCITIPEAEFRPPMLWLGQLG